MFTELYETMFGICDHINTTNPLASIQFNQAENYLKDFLYDNYLTTFLYKEIGKKLNMSFDDFLNRPRHEIESMIKIIDNVDKKKYAMNENIIQNLEKAKPKTSEKGLVDNLNP